MSQYPLHNAATHTVDSGQIPHSKDEAHSSSPQTQGPIKPAPTSSTANPYLSYISRLNSGGPPFRSFLIAVDIPIRKKPYQPSQSPSQNHPSVAAQPGSTTTRTISNSNEAPAKSLNAANDHAAQGSGSKPKKRSEKYFSDDARTKLLAAFTKSNYPDNDVKYQLAAELGLTLSQVSTWFKNKRSTVRQRKEVCPHYNLAGLTENPGEVKHDVEMKSGCYDPKISIRNEHCQEPSQGHTTQMEGVLGRAMVQRQSDLPPRVQPRPIDRDLTNKIPKQTKSSDVVQWMMHLLQGGSIAKPENVTAFVELMERADGDLETMRTMLIALQASKSPPVQKTFVDSAGHLVLQKWMKLARKDRTDPTCLQILEKAILILRELPLTIIHLQGSTIGVTVSKLAADISATLNLRSQAMQLKEHWKQMIDNSTNKIPRSEADDTKSDHPRKKTRVDDIQTLFSQEHMLPKFTKHKPSAIQVPPSTTTSHSLLPPATITTTTKPKSKIQENSNFFKELAGVLPRGSPQSPSSSSRLAMSPRSPVVERSSLIPAETHHNQKSPALPAVESFSSSATAEVHQNQQNLPPPNVERFSSSLTTEAHPQGHLSYLQNNDSKNRGPRSEAYRDTYMEVDSNQKFEAAKVHLQKVILKRKDQGQKTKKSVRFKGNNDLVTVKYFESEPPYHDHEYDEDRLRQEETDERERRARDEQYVDRHVSGYHDQLNADFERWSLRQYNPHRSEFTMGYSVTRGLVNGDYWRSPMALADLPTADKCVVQSTEIEAQAQREAAVPPVQYHLVNHIPPSPAEPDPETIPPGPPTRQIALWTSAETHASILLGSLQAISGFLSRKQLGHESVGRFTSPMPMPMHPSQH